MRSPRFLFICLLSSLAALCGTHSYAQVIPDQTLGVESSIVVPNIKVGEAITDVIEGGAIRGSNLFHSFSDFNVNDAQAFYFANPDFVESIFSRVTGEGPSNIFGRLGVEGSADLYFLNPNGVFFGPRASLDLEGSLFISSAETLKFADGSEFGIADLGNTSFLTINVPLGLQTNINVSPNSRIENSGELLLEEGKTISLIGGSVQNLGTIKIPGGEVRLVGSDVRLTNGSQIDVSNANMGGRVLIGYDAEGNSATNSVRIEKNASINASAEGIGQGGQVTIWSIDETLFSGLILARGGEQLGDGGFVEVSGESGLIYTGTVDAGAANGSAGILLIDPTNIEIVGVDAETFDLTVVDQFSDSNLTVGSTRIAASAISSSPNNVILEAQQNIVFNDDVNITTPGIGITVTAGKDIILNNSIQTSGGGAITLDAVRNISLFGQGSFIGSYGENVQLLAGDVISFQNGAQINTAPLFGDSGNIAVKARQLILTNGSQLRAAPFFGTRGGNITISASERIDLDGVGLDLSGNPISTGIITSDDFTTLSGESNISTPVLSIRNGASIGNQSVGGLASGGSVAIRDANLVEVVGAMPTSAGEFLSGIFVSPDTSGSTNSIVVDSESLVVRDGGLISISGTGSGATGSLVVNADSVLLANSSAGESPSGLIANSFGLGSPGAIKIAEAQTVKVTSGAIIDASELFSGGGSQRGAIDIDTVNLELSNGARFIVNNDGTLTINASNAFLIDSATIEATEVLGGSSGRVSINANSLDIINQSEISSASLNSGEARSLAIDVNDAFNLVDSNVTAATFSDSGRGGSIMISARDFNIIRSIVDSVPFQSGTAGTIDIKVDNLLLREQSRVSVSGLGAQSRTGDLNIRADVVRLENGSRIDATAPSTNGGNILLELGNLLVLRNGSLISAEAGTEEASNLLIPPPGLGNGGNVEIRSPFVIAIPGENSDITANAFLGNGGGVDITARGLFGIEFRDQRTEQSDITASSEFGFSGVVNVSAPDNSFLQNNLSELSNELVNTETLVASSCIARSESANGTFTLTGRDRLAQTPNETTSATYPVGTVQPIPTIAETASITEPQAIYQLADGRLLMSRDCQQ